MKYKMSFSTTINNLTIQPFNNLPYAFFCLFL